MRRQLTRRSTALALAFCAACLMVLALSAAAGAKRHGKPLIRSPHSGKTLGARPVVVRVRAGNHAKVFRVQLNGKPISKYFSNASKRGIRKLRVTPTYGLRHGKNRLHIRVRRAHGSKRSQWSRFRIRRNGPLAAAGLPHTVNAGDLVYLDGGHSRSHLKVAGGVSKKGAKKARSRLDHRWKVVAVPKGAPAGAASVSGANTKTPLLRTTVPGRYRVKLTVTAKDGSTGKDTVPVKAANPPFVSVDTMTEASGDKPGIKVGSMDPSYADDTVPNPWWQVVVYNRKTMVPISNKTYSCNRGSNGFCDDSELQQDLGKLNDTQLVIAANHMADPKWVAPGYTSFHKIGAKDYRAQDLPGDGVASYSTIGVPNTNQGEGNWHLEPVRGSGGRMEGALIIDNTGFYSYLSPPVPFDTQVYGSDTSQNVMEVGGKKFTVPLSLDANQNGRGGFQVTVIDRHKFTDGAQTYWFPTGLQDFDSGEPARLDAMSARLEQANAGDNIVIIASRGNPATQNGRDDQQQNVNNSVKRLVNAIEALGGTRTDAYQALSPGVNKSGASYTLIGHSGAGTAHGVEAQGETTTAARALNDVALSGNFERDHDYGFKVGDTAPSHIQKPTDPPQHNAAEKLNETLFQAPTPWPGDGDPGKEAAIAYFGDQVFAHDDVRYDLWHNNNTDTWWQGKKLDVKRLSYAKNLPFTKDDFAWAGTEILQEIDWLLNVRDFTTQLSKPFSAQQGLQSWADLNGIAATVQTSVQVAAQNKASSIALALFNGARQVATEIPGVGEGIGIANEIYDTALEIAKIATEGNEPADEPFSVEASKVGSELETRLNAARDTLTNQMTDAIVADYGKLKTVATCDRLDTANCPDNPQEWKFDKDDQRDAAVSLRYGSELADYQALVPAQWELWQLSNQCYGSTGYTCWETDFEGKGYGSQAFLGHVCPFIDEPNSAKLIRPVYRDIPQYRNNAGFGSNPTDIWQVYALGKLVDPGGVAPFEMNHPNDFMAKVFAPVDPAGDISRGGLGAQPERFFLGSMTPKLMGSGGQEFPVSASHVEWFGKHNDCTSKP